MKVKYDKQLKIAGIGISPWSRMGAERWFNDYIVASYYGIDVRDNNMPANLYLSHDTKQAKILNNLNTKNLLANKDFQNLILGLPGYNFITYKSLIVPEILTLKGLNFLSNNNKLTEKVENKVMFRRIFSDQEINIPKYQVYARSELSVTVSQLNSLLKGRQAVILQDEKMSGGKGTFIVSDLVSLKRALKAIQNANKSSKYVVVSEFIEDAFERTVQCCVTKTDIFIGPLQKQIVNNHILANTNVDNDKFCGAEISSVDVFASSYIQIKKYALKIGVKLRDMGYKGIYGVDCLVTRNGQVYVLEVNPRLTGVTPLLNMIFREGQDIPFYLLHILELMNAPYKITDLTVNDVSPTGSLLILHSQQNLECIVKNTLTSGAYSSDIIIDKNYKKLHTTRMQPSHLLIQQQVPRGYKISPGGRLLSVFSNKTVLNKEDKLDITSQKIVKKIESMVSLETT